MPSPIVQTLRARIGSASGPPAAVLPFGLDPIDRHLPGGGLAAAALHDIAAATADPADEASATIFLAAILARLSGPVFWCRTGADLFAPALHLAGLHADRVVHVLTADDVQVLAAMEECLRHAGPVAVVGEVGSCPTTASKRLQLAAGKGGAMAFLLRRGEAGQRTGTAAVTRWRIGARPGADPGFPGVGFPGVGRPRWHVALERARGGEPRAWMVEGADAEGRLALPALLADRPAAPEDLAA